MNPALYQLSYSAKLLGQVSYRAGGGFQFARIAISIHPQQRPGIIKP